MRKGLVRASDREAAIRRLPELELDRPEALVVWSLLEDQRERFPLLGRMLEKMYGPGSDVSYPPAELSSLKLELSDLTDSLRSRDASDLIASSHVEGVTAGVLLEFLQEILQVVELAQVHGESLFAFGD